MKKFKIQILLFMLIQFNAIGQTINPTHIGGGLPTEYVGWTNAQSLDFWTSNAPWMTLDITGNLGISQTFPFTPLNKLHINGDNTAGSVPTRIQITDANTGVAATDGFQIGNVSNGALPNGTAEIVQNEAAPTIFYNRDPSLNSVVERLRFTHNNAMIDYSAVPGQEPDGV